MRTVIAILCALVAAEPLRAEVDAALGEALVAVVVRVLDDGSGPGSGVEGMEL